MTHSQTATRSAVPDKKEIGGGGLSSQRILRALAMSQSAPEKEEEVKIKELKPRMPVTITKSDSLTSAAKLLADEDIGALVVYEPQGLAGIISERDIVRAVADGLDLAETEVCDYMTQAPVVAEEDAVIGDAIAKMNDARIRHVVVGSDGDVTGMISVRDVIALLGTDWPEP